ncbi:MAG: hypothetical protein M1157_00495 [Deinococcus sp.]|nr:hypothetical protein [Deinococcus sp.]
MFFQENVKKLAKKNEFFRKVVYTGKGSQSVLMLHPRGQDTGEAPHAGTGQAAANGETLEIEEGDILLVPAGFKAQHHEHLRWGTKYLPGEFDRRVKLTRARGSKEHSAAFQAF